MVADAAEAVVGQRRHLEAGGSAGFGSPESVLPRTGHGAHAQGGVAPPLQHGSGSEGGGGGAGALAGGGGTQWGAGAGETGGVRGPLAGSDPELLCAAHDEWGGG